MNAELEALVRALDAVMEARGGEEAEKFEATYETKLQEVLSGHPGLSRERLVRAVDFAHRKWQHTREKKPASMPPRA